MVIAARFCGENECSEADSISTIQYNTCFIEAA